MKEINYRDFVYKILEDEKDGCPYETQGTFDNFYEPFLRWTEKNLNMLFKDAEEKGRFKVSCNAVLSIVKAVKESLVQACLKTLISEFYELKSLENLESSNDTKLYDLYNESFKDKNEIRKVLDKYDVLVYLIYLKVKGSYDFIREALENLLLDADDIRLSFNKKLEVLEGVNFKCADTHNGGRSVIIFEFSSKEKVVYKPHRLDGDSLLSEIYDFMNKGGALRKNLFNVKNIKRESYGWQDFVDSEKGNNSSIPADYYYRIGAALAIFNVLNCGDMHAENIIAAKDNPFFIDTENLIINDSSVKVDDSLYTAYMQEISSSVLGSYILPRNIEYSPIDIDLSGLCDGKRMQSKKVTYMALKNPGRDSICFKKEYVITDENNNIPYVNGEKARPAQFISSIEEGFKDSYSFILGNREEFKSQILRMLKDGTYRQVLRPTFIYSRYIEASHHPKYLKSFEDRRRLFAILKECDKKSFADNEIIMQRDDIEIDSLMNEDIPYFYTDFESENVYSGKNVVNGYFQRSVREVLEERINKMSLLSMENQLSYIRNSFAISANNAFTAEDNKAGEKLDLSLDDIDISLKSIGDYIYNKAVFNEKRTACTYSSINTEDERMVMGHLDYTLYNGGGLVLFLYALANELKDEKYQMLAEASLKGIEELDLADKSYKVSPSAFLGTCSLVYMYYNLSIMENNQIFNDKYKKYLKMLMDYENNESDGTDIIGGYAGVITVCLNIYQDCYDEDALITAEKYAYLLYENLQKKKGGYLSGFSHGYSGYALALMMAGRILENCSYYNLALDLIKEEDKLYSSSLGNWIDLRAEGKNKCGSNYWCHGAPGILLARCKMMSYAEDEDFELLSAKVPQAFKKLSEDGFSKDAGSCLCHGIMGNLDILREIVSEKTSLQSNYDINQLFRKCLGYLKDEGIKYSINNSSGIVDFMTGISGIGYSILRQKNHHMPSILALDVIGRKEVNE